MNVCRIVSFCYVYASSRVTKQKWMPAGSSNFVELWRGSMSCMRSTLIQPIKPLQIWNERFLITTILQTLLITSYNLHGCSVPANHMAVPFVHANHTAAIVLLKTQCTTPKTISHHPRSPVAYKDAYGGWTQLFRAPFMWDGATSSKRNL